jgi:hypothetical protein
MGKCDVPNIKAQLIMLDSIYMHLSASQRHIERFVIVDCNCQQIHSFPKHMLCSPFFFIGKSFAKKRREKANILKMKREIGGLPFLKGRKR